jgi:hypothetical protein
MRSGSYLRNWPVPLLPQVMMQTLAGGWMKRANIGDVAPGGVTKASQGHARTLAALPESVQPGPAHVAGH